MAVQQTTSCSLGDVFRVLRELDGHDDDHLGTLWWTLAARGSMETYRIRFETEDVSADDWRSLYLLQCLLGGSRRQALEPVRSRGQSAVVD